MSSSTPVVNRHHKTEFTVYVGRGSDWGNPYPIENGNREQVIRRYEDYLRGNRKLLAKVGSLRGETLGCFCFPSVCHGDILAAFADSVHGTGLIPRDSVSDRLFEGKSPKRRLPLF